MSVHFDVAFAKLWLVSHPAQPVPEAAMAAFFDALSDLEERRLVDVMDELGRTSVRMPTAGEIRKLVEQQMQAERAQPRTARFTLEGERTYDCPYCKDTSGNWVHVVATPLVEWFASQFGEEGPFPANWAHVLNAYDRIHTSDNLNRFSSPKTPRDAMKICCCQFPGKRHVTFEARKGRPAVTYAVFDPEHDCVHEFPVHEAVAKFLGATVGPPIAINKD